MTFRPVYAMAAAAVFATEVLIGLFVHDGLIRPYLGDSLAVALVYVALRSVTPWRVIPALLATLGFAALIEFGQLFHLIDRLGLSDSVPARFILGGVFDGRDFVSYAFGGICVLMVETVRRERLI